MEHVKRAFDKMKERKWDCIYFAIDIHGTVIKSTYNKDTHFEYYPNAEKVLKYLSTREDIKLIIYTSSHEGYINDLLNNFVEKHIYFDYVNENPEVDTNKLSDFSKKFHFDVLLDDKAGFEPDRDWPLLYQALLDHDQS